jgi:hypothetical protein
MPGAVRMKSPATPSSAPDRRQVAQCGQAAAAQGHCGRLGGALAGPLDAALDGVLRLDAPGAARLADQQLRRHAGEEVLRQVALADGVIGGIAEVAHGPGGVGEPFVDALRDHHQPAPEPLGQAALGGGRFRCCRPWFRGGLRSLRHPGSQLADFLLARAGPGVLARLGEEGGLSRGARAAACIDPVINRWPLRSRAGGVV